MFSSGPHRTDARLAGIGEPRSNYVSNKCYARVLTSLLQWKISICLEKPRACPFSISPPTS